MTTSYNTSGASTIANERHVRPARSVHHVKPGESIGSIANMYGISQLDLIRNNSHALGNGGLVHPGMRLEVGLCRG